MSLDWGPHTQAAAKRQSDAIRSVATERRHHKIADRAAAGEFTDYSDAHDCPITELLRLCLQVGLHDIATRLENGEFDATKEESDEWMKSESGQEIARELSPQMRNVVGMKLNSENN